MTTEQKKEVAPTCEICGNTRQVYVDDFPMPCVACCCVDCGVSPDEKHFSECAATRKYQRLHRIGELMDIDPGLGTPEGEELSRLADEQIACEKNLLKETK